MAEHRKWRRIPAILDHLVARCPSYDYCLRGERRFRGSGWGWRRRGRLLRPSGVYHQKLHDDECRPGSIHSRDNGPPNRLRPMSTDSDSDSEPGLDPTSTVDHPSHSAPKIRSKVELKAESVSGDNSDGKSPLILVLILLPEEWEPRLSFLLFRSFTHPEPDTLIRKMNQKRRKARAGRRTPEVNEFRKRMFDPLSSSRRP